MIAYVLNGISLGEDGKLQIYRYEYISKEMVASHIKH